MKFKVFMITLILFCLAATTMVMGAVTPTRLDSVQIRKGLKTNYGIDIGTYLNVAGTSAFTGNVTFSGNTTVTGVNKTLSGFGINIPSLDDPTFVFGMYSNWATDQFDSTGKQINGLAYYCDSTEYKPVIPDSGGLMLKAFGIRADDDSGYVKYSFEPILMDTIGGKETGFFVELSLPDTTQYEVYVGFAEKNIAADNKISNGVYFRMVDATNKMIFTTARGGTMDSVTAIANTAASTFYKLAFSANGSGTVTGYVNGVALTAISKYIPRTANLTPFIMVKQGQAVVNRQWVYIKNFGFFQYR